MSRKKDEPQAPEAPAAEAAPAAPPESQPAADTPTAAPEVPPPADPPAPAADLPATLPTGDTSAPPAVAPPPPPPETGGEPADFVEIVEEEQDGPAPPDLLAEAVNKGLVEPNDLVILNMGDPVEFTAGGVVATIARGKNHVIESDRRVGKEVVEMAAVVPANAALGFRPVWHHGWSAKSLMNHAQTALQGGNLQFTEERPEDDPSHRELLALLGRSK